jgi:predicted phosphoribosyltransferase
MLAAALDHYADRPDVIVLALPRGGVPVGYEVAEKLHAPLDVMVVRKLGVPGWEELAMGAIASGGVRVLNERVVREAGLTAERIDRVANAEWEELKRREMAFRGHTGAPEVAGKTVILVDDGIATGSTIRAAVQALRQQGPDRIVIAVPTAAADSCEMLEPMVDELVSLVRPAYFRAVGQWYDDFAQTTDDEVKQLLEKARARRISEA